MKHYSFQNKDKNTQKVLLYIGLFGLIPFLYFAIIGYFDWAEVTGRDYEIGAFFYNLRTPMRTTIATGITRLADLKGQAAVAIIMTLLLTFTKKWRTGLWYGLTVLFGSGFLNGAVKALYQRVRPDQIPHLIEQDGFAFPSGHAMGSMIVYGGLLFIILRYLATKRGSLGKTKWVLGILFGLLILSIGLSRIYLGVHYPSDVIAGFSLGLSWICFSISTLGLKFTKQDFRRQNKYRFR